MGFVGLFQFALKRFDILAWPMFALVYPLCASIQAIETNSNSDTQKLITYWVSFSLIFLFECAFEKLLQWLTVWPYVKLMIVGCLVVPRFDGSVYVYKHLVHPCLSMDSRIVVSQFNKLKELLFKKDDFVVEVERYVKENGPDALENLIAFKKKSTDLDVAAKEIKALAMEDLPKMRPKLQPKFEEPKLPHKESNAVETIEQKEVATTKQVRQIEPKIPRALNKASAPSEIKETATAALTGRDIFEIPPSEKVQKEWTCSICQVTTQSETVFNSHLQGKKHKKKQMLESQVSAASVGKKPSIPIAAAGIGVGVHTSKNVVPKTWTCVVCRETVKSQMDIDAHLQGKRHKEAFELLMANNQGSNSKVSILPAGKESNVPGKESENCTSSSSISPEIRRRTAIKDGKRKSLLEPQVVEIRNGKWWCTICNISCTCEGNMKSHLIARKHLAKMQKLSNAGGSGPA